MADEPVIIGKHRLHLDGEWGLMDFSGFGRHYVQVYAVLYALQIPAPRDQEEDEEDDRAVRAFRAFPWRGGWSAVGFYEQLRIAVPPKHRPRLVAIEYASPGFMDLGGPIEVLTAIEKTVKLVCWAYKEASAAYRKYYKGAQDRKLLNDDVRNSGHLTPEQLEYADEAAEAIAALMELPRDALWRLTRSPVGRMKITFSVYRRVRELAKLLKANRIGFKEKDDDNDEEAGT